jgi:hypothetical protein
MVLVILGYSAGALRNQANNRKSMNIGVRAPALVLHAQVQLISARVSIQISTEHELKVECRALTEVGKCLHPRNLYDVNSCLRAGDMSLASVRADTNSLQAESHIEARVASPTSKNPESLGLVRTYAWYFRYRRVSYRPGFIIGVTMSSIASESPSAGPCQIDPPNVQT